MPLRTVRPAAALAVETDAETTRFTSERFNRRLAAALASILEQGRAESLSRPIDPLLFYFSLVGACDHPFVARHSLRYAFGIDDIDDALRRAYAEHISDIDAQRAAVAGRLIPRRLAGLKLPKSIAFIGALPKTPPAR